MPSGRQVIRLDGCVIIWHRERDADVDGRLISILDTASAVPARRVCADGHQEQLADVSTG